MRLDVLFARESLPWVATRDFCWKEIVRGERQHTNFFFGTLYALLYKLCFWNAMADSRMYQV